MLAPTSETQSNAVAESAVDFGDDAGNSRISQFQDRKNKISNSVRRRAQLEA